MKTLAPIAATKAFALPARAGLTRPPQPRGSADDAETAPPGLDQRRPSVGPDVGHEFSKIAVRRPSAITIQAKLVVNRPGDEYEQEADRIAEQVAGMSVSPTESTACIRAQAQTPVEAANAETKPLGATITPLVQRASSASTGVAPSPTTENRLRANVGGSPLPAGIRAFMEPRFGVDFSAVRLHSGSEADKLNRSVQARAFTYGKDIYLGAGNGDLESEAGRRLLAHELTHTVQQGAVARGSDGNIQRDDPKPPSAEDLDQLFNEAVQSGDWFDAAKTLSRFSRLEITNRLARLTSGQIASLHQGALDSGDPQSQLAELTQPGAPAASSPEPGSTSPPPVAQPASPTPAAPDSTPVPAASAPTPVDNATPSPQRDAQLACVVRLGGCRTSIDAGLPSPEDIAHHNRDCRKGSHYEGPDITPTEAECRNPPKEPLSAGEQIFLAVLLGGAAAAATAAIIVVGAEVLPVVIASVGEAATAGAAFYAGNAIVVNQVGLFAAGLLFSCEGNLPGLLKAMADDPLQATAILAEVVVLHVEIQIANQPGRIPGEPEPGSGSSTGSSPSQSAAPRRAAVPSILLPPSEQTGPGIRFKSVGPPQFEDEAPAGSLPKTPAATEHPDSPVPEQPQPLPPENKDPAAPKTAPPTNATPPPDPQIAPGSGPATSIGELAEPELIRRYYPDAEQAPPKQAGFDAIEGERTLSANAYKDGKRVVVERRVTGGRWIQLKTCGSAYIVENVNVAMERAENALKGLRAQPAVNTTTSSGTVGNRLVQVGRPDRFTIHLDLVDGVVTPELEAAANQAVAKSVYLNDLPPVDVVITSKNNAAPVPGSH